MATQEGLKYQTIEGSKVWHKSFDNFVKSFHNGMDDLTALYQVKEAIEMRKEKFHKKNKMNLVEVCEDELFFINRRLRDAGL